MTEAEWLACTDPDRMLTFLGRTSERKLRLFAVAACRPLLRHTASQRSRHAVEVAERFAEGKATHPELSAAFAQSLIKSRNARLRPTVSSRARQAAHLTTSPYPRDAAVEVARALAPDAVLLCDLLRDIFGPEPFRPVEVHPAWHTGAVKQMARVIYEQGRFDDLPVLADALEEAGCADPDILAHCRGGGEHVRGCWVVDLLLARE